MEVCLKRPLTDEDLLERAGIDGRVAFAMAAFVLAAGIVALLDRVGVPEGIVGVLGPVVAVAGLALIGLLMHAMRVSRFYAAGRAVPAPYAGLSLVAMIAGIALPFLPPSPANASLGGLAAGLAAGFLIAAFVTGPLLRKTGAFSFPDMLASRFPNMGVRLGVVTVVGASSLLVAVAGYESAIRMLEISLGTGRNGAALIAGLVLLLMIVPGGMSGVVWGGTGAMGILIAGLLLPLAVVLAGGEQLPAPVLGDPAAWGNGLALAGVWQAAGSAGESIAGGGLLVAALALGIGSLAPLLTPAITTRDASATRAAGVTSLFWLLFMTAVLAIAIVAAAIVAEQWLSGERPDRLPSFAYAASAGELLRICGQYAPGPEAALEACRQMIGSAGLVLRPQDYSPSGLWLVLSIAELRDYSVAFSGLIAAGLICVALVVASSGFQCFATALGHDAIYRVRESAALTSRRLAMTRVIMVLAIAFAGILLARGGIDPRRWIALGILLSAAAIAPLLALSLWPRASGVDAALALLAGLCSAGAAIAYHGKSPDVGELALAAVISCALAFATGVAASFLHSGGLASAGTAFVHGVLHGESDVMHIDKGA